MDSLRGVLLWHELAFDAHGKNYSALSVEICYRPQTLALLSSCGQDVKITVQSGKITSNEYNWRKAYC